MRLKGTLAVTVAMAACAVLSGTVAAGPGSAAAPVAAARPGQWVTLVTGDRVLVRQGGGEQAITIRPAKGRESLSFHRFERKGDMFVVPVDAEPMMAAGKLDRALFNVSKLLELGYGDKARNDIPLIVVGATGSGARLARELPSLRGQAVRADKGTAGKLWDSLRGKASRVVLDGQVRASLEQSVPHIGAPAAWQAGHTGQGVTVAVLDTGIDATHPELADAVVNSADFTRSESGAADVRGHGTHVASIITGARGVAPAARLLNGKVLNDSGGGYLSDIIAGMEWAVAEGADIVNMSLGTRSESDGTDLLDQTVNRLSAESDTLFVVSAGNSGPGTGTLTSPGAADAALTVGAVSKQDALAEFSSRGPRAGDRAVKPDITAPGVDISAVGGTLSGTSMAAPHVAGAAAILAGQRPELGGEELKALLMGTAKPHGDLTVYQQGAGRVDVARATGQGTFAMPASVSNGIARWPHEDDAPIESVLTYRNVADSPVTLDLAVDVRGPSGAAAPAGMFKVDTVRVTIPAGGNASVRLTTNTSVPAPDGLYGGTLVATGADGHTAARVPVGLFREPESYNVTMKYLDHNGQPTAQYWTTLLDIANPEAYYPFDASGTVVARLPRGQYFLTSQIQTPDPTQEAGFLATMVHEPTLDVTRDVEFTFDARDGKRFGATVDRAASRRIETWVGSGRTVDWGFASDSYSGWGMDFFHVRPSTTTAPEDQFEFRVRTTLGEPGGTPYVYNIQWSQHGRIPTELMPRIRDRELATVYTHLSAISPDRMVGKLNPIKRFTAPVRLTEYYTPGVAWYGEWDQFGADPEWPDLAMFSEPRTFRLGRPTTERWFAAVFGPAFSAGQTWVGRRENTITVDVPTYVDQAPDHYGGGAVDTARTTLYRNGQKIGETDQSGSGFFDVPADPATYRLEVESARSISDLSGRISSAWTFRSEHVVAPDPKAPALPLPFMAVRFAPELDDNNRAPSGCRFSFPVYVQQQAGARYGALTSISLQVSYDDGATWTPARLTGDGLRRTAHVEHPRGRDFVSLKASATDSAGNSVEQTIIHAYALRPAPVTPTP